MHSLIIGYGSIGKRHARVLQKLNHRVDVVSAHGTGDHRFYTALGEVDAGLYDYAVIANMTSDHEATLLQLIEAGAACPILVEKPLFSEHSTALVSALKAYAHPIYVGYNLRFHPITKFLKNVMSQSPALSASLYTGQHLTQWRPGTEVKDSYSAHHARGGGVIRDLSHELDMVAYLFGEPLLRGAMHARTGAITHDSEDCAAALLTAPHCPIISLQINYLDHVATRKVIINAEDDSYHADYIAGVVTHKTGEQVFTCERDETYRNMHRAVFSDADNTLCRFEEGLQILALIDAMEHAS